MSGYAISLDPWFIPFLALAIIITIKFDWFHYVSIIDCLEKVRKKTYNSRNYVVVTVRVLVIILSYESTFYCNGILAFLPEHGQCLVS